MINLFGETIKNNIPLELQKLVEEVLEEYPETRDNDMFLYIKVWEKQGYELPKDFITAAKPETIGRWRRFLQQKGLYKGLKERKVWG